MVRWFTPSWSPWMCTASLAVMPELRSICSSYHLVAVRARSLMAKCLSILAFRSLVLSSYPT